MSRFAKLVSEFASEAKLEAERVRKKAALLLTNDIIHNTPVGDPDLWNISEEFRQLIKASGYVGGTLRGNWFVGSTLGNAPVKRVDKEGSTTLAMAQESMGQILPDQPIFIYNAVPYAYLIEYTPHSVQQPPGVMCRAQVSKWDLYTKVK